MTEEARQNFRRYNTQRELKATLRVNSNKGIIYMPEGITLSKTDHKRVNILISEFNYVIQPELFDVPVWEKVMIGRSIGLRGKGINFKKERMHGVLPGTGLLQVGKGKDSPKNRVDKFSTPGKYTGTIVIEDVKYYALLLPPDKVPDPEVPHYLLYQDGHGGQLMRHIYKSNGDFDYSRLYLAEFKLARPVKEPPVDRQNKLKF